MAVTKTGGMGIKILEDMALEELVELAKTLKIKVVGEKTSEELVKIISDSGKYTKVKSNTGSAVDSKGAKTHKVLGKYIKVKVYPQELSQKNSSIFCAINAYTFEFQPNTVVELPMGIVKFLKDSSIPEHYYDANAVSDNGNIGAHKTRDVNKFIVEVINDELESLQ